MSDSISKKTIRILVAGEDRVGKSCLTIYFRDWIFIPNVARVLPPIHIEGSRTDIGISMVFYDTSRNWTREKWKAKLQQADAIILCYACNDALTLEKAKSHWLPLFRRLEANIPIILTKCKSDLAADNIESVEAEVKSIMGEHPEIESYIECSTRSGKNVYEVFYNAQKAVVYPCNILFDRSKDCLKVLCKRALKRIFIYFDKDEDGALNDAELSNFQVTCFGEQLNSIHISDVKVFLERRFPEGLNLRGITFNGFIFLHTFYIKEGHSAMPWTCLRKFEYDNHIKIREGLLPTYLTWNSHQRVELAEEAMTFLRRIFAKFDVRNDGALQPARIHDLFSTAPESPWTGGHYVDAAENKVTGELTLNGFLSLWTVMTLLEPGSTFANLKYIGYKGNCSSALYVSKRMGLFWKREHQSRNVFQCYVFGPRKAGKSAMLNLLIGRPFCEEYTPTTQQRFTANVISLPGQTEKILVMVEIPPDEVSTQLMNPDFLARCDIAIFVYDSSDQYSWMEAFNIFKKVSGLVEQSGFNVPCLFVAAKSDLEQNLFIQEDSLRVCKHLSLQPPMFISLGTRENNIFQTIVLAAQRPDHNLLKTKPRINFIFYSLSAVGATILGGLAVVHMRNMKKLKERGDHH